MEGRGLWENYKLVQEVKEDKKQTWIEKLKPHRTVEKPFHSSSMYLTGIGQGI
jgi:hypothetical protein